MISTTRSPGTLGTYYVNDFNKYGSDVGRC